MVVYWSRSGAGRGEGPIRRVMGRRDRRPDLAPAPGGRGAHTGRPGARRPRGPGPGPGRDAAARCQRRRRSMTGPAEAAAGAVGRGPGRAPDPAGGIPGLARRSARVPGRLQDRRAPRARLRRRPRRPRRRAAAGLRPRLKRPSARTPPRRDRSRAGPGGPIIRRRVRLRARSGASAAGLEPRRLDGMERSLLLLVLVLIAPPEAPGQDETGAGASSALAAARLSTRRAVAEQQATLDDVWAEMARRGLTCTVLDAAPSVRVYADSQAVSREVASPANDLGRTTIIKYDQMYLWASRDYRELVYGISGVYH